MSDSHLKLVLDSKTPLTVRTLMGFLRNFTKVMKAQGADDLQIMSLHYEYDATLSAPQKATPDRIRSRRGTRKTAPRRNKMDELLRRFVELAPKEWRVSLKSCEEYDWLHFSAPMFCVRLDDDRYSAQAIVFLWDYLQAIDGSWITSCYERGWCFRSVNGPEEGSRGDTRIEALVRACVALWEQSTPEE